MTPPDQVQIGNLRQRADDILSLAIKAAVHAHAAYHYALDEKGFERGDVKKAIRTYGSRLATLRIALNDQFDVVLDLIGRPPAPEAPTETSTTPSARMIETAATPLTPLQKLAAALDLLGELTNAQVQKLMGCDSDSARKIIDGFVGQGLLIKVSPKLYKVPQKEPVS